MKICMTGIDYKHSELSVRERFAIGKDKAQHIMAAFLELPYVNGCTIISTCNRTEIYASIEKDKEFCIPEFLCGVLNIDYAQYADRFVNRDESDTFYHLCAVASGIDSQILGDDQIITQVRESVELSRSFGFTDSYMETMFRTAVKAAKDVKTNITVRPEHTASAPYKAVELLKAASLIKGKNAVVIGNGQMGRLASELLISESVNVTVTLREYKNGKIIVPTGASTINYSARYEAVEKAQILVSATTSPHYTVRHEDFIKLKTAPDTIVDLAVPRDIEPSIGGLPGITLYTIDDLGDQNGSLSADKKRLADQIIHDNMENYYKWREYKENNK